jgi:hypothetical protein
VILEDLSSIQVNFLRNPYKEIAYLFSRAASQESTATIHQLALNILHFSIHDKVIFVWMKIIYGEIYFQLSNCKKN